MKFAKAATLGILALGYASTASAAIIVDGLYDSDYGAPTASVAHDPSAPDSNFGTPGNTTAGAAYNIYLTSQGGFVYGLVQITGNAESSAGAFANVYFGNAGGSTIGFEITNGNVFKPGVPGSFALPYSFSIAPGGTGIEFALSESLFTSPIGATGINAGLNPGDQLILRLSQSFGYSVAGGATYGADRLGAVTLEASAVPGPIVGAGLPGLVMALGGFVAWRRRRNQAAAA
jgi:hypothetical protein